jgi:hypothetical protein
MIHRKTEGEVEITVIKRAVPSDADLMPAHQTRQRIWIEGFSEKSEVISLLPQVGQMCSESSQWHIGDGEKLGEADAEAFTQLVPVILFEGRLARRQKRASRIIDKT